MGMFWKKEASAVFMGDLLYTWSAKYEERKTNKMQQLDVYY